MEKKTVVLLTYGKTREHSHGDCVEQLKHELGVQVLEVRASTQIDIARSHLACAAIAVGADVAFFIDHDMVFDPLDVERLADAAREREGVVGAPYSRRQMGAPFVGSLSPQEHEVIFFEGGGVHEAPGILGMGFTAIHRSVFQKMDALPGYGVRNTNEGPVTPYFQKIVVDGYWLHEDASFCHSARIAGAGTFLDTRIRVAHLGEHPFTIEDCRRLPTREASLKLKVRAQ